MRILVLGSGACHRLALAVLGGALAERAIDLVRPVEAFDIGLELMEDAICALEPPAFAAWHRRASSFPRPLFYVDASNRTVKDSVWSGHSINPIDLHDNSDQPRTYKE